MTPLGSPLVPLVYMIVHMSNGCGGEGSDGFFLPWKNKRCSIIQQNKQPLTAKDHLRPSVQ